MSSSCSRFFVNSRSSIFCSSKIASSASSISSMSSRSILYAFFGFGMLWKFCINASLSRLRCISSMYFCCSADIDIEIESLSHAESASSLWPSTGAAKPALIGVSTPCGGILATVSFGRRIESGLFMLIASSVFGVCAIVFFWALVSIPSWTSGPCPPMSGVWAFIMLIMFRASLMRLFWTSGVLIVIGVCSRWDNSPSKAFVASFAPLVKARFLSEFILEIISISLSEI
mmetsp:Transcript_32805/g.37537  ORF Transcript_32805/g.37537 Transcript_32805/m.37537 type:complete len:230 (+) Transcript_32805:756-1445(+)